jgi:hypothetical protein
VVGGAVARIAARLEVEQDNDDREDDAHWTGAEPQGRLDPGGRFNGQYGGQYAKAREGRGADSEAADRPGAFDQPAPMASGAASFAPRVVVVEGAAEAAGQPPQRRGNAEDRADDDGKQRAPGAS